MRDTYFGSVLGFILAEGRGVSLAESCAEERRRDAEKKRDGLGSGIA